MAKTELEKLEQEMVFESSTVDGNAVNAKIMRGIAGADNVDDILSAGGAEVQKLTDVANEPVTITACAFHESSDEYSDGGWGFFAVFECVTEDGVVHTVSAGARTVVLKLYQINKVAGFPIERKVVFTSSRTKSGYTVWDMTAAK